MYQDNLTAPGQAGPDPHRADPGLMRLALEVLRPTAQQRRTICFHCARPLVAGACGRCDR